MNKEWKDQLVAITGAGSGLGTALCANFIARGARVLGLDLNVEALSGLQKKWDSSFLPAKCDVTNHEEVAQLFSRHEVDVLINSAGITGKTNLKSYETDPADIARIFQVNFFGSYHTSRIVLPGMASRGYGRVLHIASIAGKEGNAGMLGYSASKAAVIGMAKVQGKEMAGTGVTVNALAPAVIQTPLVDAMPETQVKYMTEKIPMHRCGTLDEFVAMADFIVSPACSFTTAFTFDLSGGRATY
jgi:NAD(P)-dependent dehydrogenase (short-subunit alcohol dehydrogenase family)